MESTRGLREREHEGEEEREVHGLEEEEELEVRGLEEEEELEVRGRGGRKTNHRGLEEE